MSAFYVLLIAIAAIASYVIIGLRLMHLCNASGVGNGWFSFIPLLAETRMARLAGANPWLVILAIIPVVNIAFAVLRWIWLWRISGHTQARQWWWVSLLGPIGIGVAFGIFSGGGFMTFAVYLIGIAIMTYAIATIFNPMKAIPGVADNS